MLYTVLHASWVMSDMVLNLSNFISLLRNNFKIPFATWDHYKDQISLHMPRESNFQYDYGIIIKISSMHN